MSESKIANRRSQEVKGSARKVRYLLSATCYLTCYLLPANCLLRVFVVDIRRRRSSLQSFIIDLYSEGVNMLVSLSRSSQYSVSAHSFREIDIFTRYSFSLTEYFASLKFAPMDVPERNNCLARTYSRFSSQRYLYKLYILIANFLLFSNAILIILNINNQTTKNKIGENI